LANRLSVASCFIIILPLSIAIVKSYIFRQWDSFFIVSINQLISNIRQYLFRIWFLCSQDSYCVKSGACFCKLSQLVIQYKYHHL